MLVGLTVMGEVVERRAQDHPSDTVVVADSADASTARERGDLVPNESADTIGTAQPAEAGSKSIELTSALTPLQRSAVHSAESYLEMSGFSRQGLIDALASELGDQVPVGDVIVAVDSLNVDWAIEAVKSAESYLGDSGFSCEGLIDQLSSDHGDQYTIEQATHAAEHVGIC